MSLYEGMFLIDNRQANRDWDGSLDKVKAMLAKHGAEIIRNEKWGERKLAYEIKGHRRGTYILIYFKAAGEAVGRIYRECELSEMVLRALILQIPVVPPEGEERPQLVDDEFPAGRAHGRRRSEVVDAAVDVSEEVEKIEGIGGDENESETT